MTYRIHRDYWGGGAAMKQDVAVNDKNGDLRMKMHGLKDGTKTDAKPDTSDALRD